MTPLQQAAKYLALAGTLAFLVAVVLTVTDIVLRTVSTYTVQGLTDIVTLCTMIGAMLAIPYGFAVNQHVSIDVFTMRMPKGVQRWLQLASYVLAAAFLGAVFWFSVKQMLTEYDYGDRSQSIGIPMVWYWLPLIVGLAISVVVSLWLLVSQLFGARGD